MPVSLVCRISSEDTSLTSRCSNAPRQADFRQGHDTEGPSGRRCLYNGLLAIVRLGQRHVARFFLRDTIPKPPLTSGKSSSAGEEVMAVENQHQASPGGERLHPFGKMYLKTGALWMRPWAQPSRIHARGGGSENRSGVAGDRG